MNLKLKFIGLNESDVIVTSCANSNDPVVKCIDYDPPGEDPAYYEFGNELGNSIFGGMADDENIFNGAALEIGKKYHVHKVSDTSFTFELCEDSSHNDYATRSYFFPPR